MNTFSNVNQSQNKIAATFLQAITIFIVNKTSDCAERYKAALLSPSPLPRVLQGVLSVLFVLTLGLWGMQWERKTHTVTRKLQGKGSTMDTTAFCTTKVCDS